MKELIPSGWENILKTELNSEEFKNLERFLDDEWKNKTVFPKKEEIFTALKLTPYSKVKVVILGQDPYHDDHQAHGLAFSVKGNPTRFTGCGCADLFPPDQGRGSCQLPVVGGC